MDHLISEKCQDHKGTDPNYLHALFLFPPTSPMLLTQEAFIVPASCFSKVKQYVVLQTYKIIEFVI